MRHGIHQVLNVAVGSTPVARLAIRAAKGAVVDHERRHAIGSKRLRVGLQPKVLLDAQTMPHDNDCELTGKVLCFINCHPVI